MGSNDKHGKASQMRSEEVKKESGGQDQGDEGDGKKDDKEEGVEKEKEEKKDKDTIKKELEEKIDKYIKKVAGSGSCITLQDRGILWAQQSTGWRRRGA